MNYSDATLKDYGGRYKLTVFNYSRKKTGFEDEHKKFRITGVNDEKLECNVSRAKQKIYEYSMCNDFSYFITLTLDKRFYDRYDLQKYKKDLGMWINNYNKIYSTKIKYLLIPEQHEDGAWHMHGLLSGIVESQLREFKADEVLPYNILSLINKGEKVYDWEKYRNKFGYVTVSKIKSKDAVSAYITKYVSKDLAKSLKELNAHLYYSSNGLNTAKKIAEGKFDKNITFDYKNDYVNVKWLSFSQLSDLMNDFILHEK